MGARNALASARPAERDSPPTSSKGKFLLEPLEPRVLLSADSILGEVYRTLANDEAERDGSQFAVIVEEIDAATSAEIAAAGSENSGAAASESAPVVAWGDGWQSTAVEQAIDETQAA